MNTAIQEFATTLSTDVSDDDSRLAAAIVKEAATLAERMRANGLNTEYKTSISDVVTAADRAAEEFVVSTLALLRPDDGILGEEGSAKESSSGRTWVIDPVDGTYNFTTNSDYWCSALALIFGTPEQPSELILGAVHRTSTGQTWIGGPRIETKVYADNVHEHPDSEDSASTMAAAVIPPATSACVQNVALADTCAATYLHTSVVGSKDEEESLTTQSWLKAASQCATWRMLGSASVDMASVAEGRLGVWFQRDVAPWDWLPGQALVAGAGGSCVSVGRWKIAGSAKAVDELANILK